MSLALQKRSATNQKQYFFIVILHNYIVESLQGKVIIPDRKSNAMLYTYQGCISEEPIVADRSKQSKTFLHAILKHK
jgi:hypothetical protein